MAEMKISNTLVNDTSDKTIAYAEQLKQQIINWAEYNHVTEKLGPNNRPNTQNLLNNLFLRVYEEFLTFLNNADATDQAINTWKEIEAFLAGYTDDKTLASIVAQLNANIESRLNVQLADETGDSVTTTMTQKAITKAINSVSFSTGEKVKEIGIADEPTAGSDNLVKSGGVYKEARKIVDSSNTRISDLEFSDEYGNVLAQFKNGHIKTKNFDSSKISELMGGLIEDSEMDDVLGGDVAVYLVDVNNNAVLDEEGKPIEII